MKRVYRSIGSITLGWLIGSCGGGDSVTGPPPPPTTATVTISSDTATLVPAATVQLSATARSASGDALQRSFVWSSSDPTKATVSTAGIVAGVAPGTATITATVDGKSGTSTVTVLDGGVVSSSGATLDLESGTVQLVVPADALASSTNLSVVASAAFPTDPRVIKGTVFEFGPPGTTFAKAVGLRIRYDRANVPLGTEEAALEIYLSTSSGWQVVPGSMADVAAKVVSVQVSHFSIYAILTPDAVASITIGGPPGKPIVNGASSVVVGESEQLTATLTASDGRILSNRVVTWSSTDATIASISPTGVLAAVKPGSATINASAGGKTSSVVITVNPVPVATVTVSPATASLVVGGAPQQLTATLRDANNNVLTGRVVTWSSSNEAAASVSATGLVTAAGAGAATITATSETQTGTATITVTLATASGPLRVSTVNPRYFADPSGRVVYLTGSHYWKNVHDNGTTNPPPAFDNAAYLDFLQQHNHNFTRLWVWEQAKWNPLTSVDHWFSPTLYERPGPGTAADEDPKFDLTRINPAYLARVRQRVIDAGARGIYVSVMLFDGWSVETKPGFAGANPWLAHPFNAANNINGINGDPNGDQSGRETQTLSISEVTAYQETYVKAVVDAVNDLDNVIYEISNESDASGNAWQYHMINFLRSYEVTKPKQHPIGMTAPWPNGSNSDVLNSPADWVSMSGDINNLVVADGFKVSLSDTDHLCGICGDWTWPWRSLTAGHNTLLMDGYDGSPGMRDPAYNPNNSIWEEIRTNMGYARSFALRMDLSRALPRGDLASSGYCLAVVGSEYLVFVPGGGSMTINLSGVSGSRTVEWFNPANGQTTAGGTVPGGGTVTLTTPFSGSAAVYIHP